MKLLRRTTRALQPKWLLSSDECDRLAMNAWMFGNPLLAKFFFVSEDREPDVVGSQDVGQVVESGPHLVDDFTCEDGVLDEEWARQIGLNNDFLVIHVGQDAIRAVARIVGQATVERLELLVGPVEFGHDPLDGIIRHAVSSTYERQPVGSAETDNAEEVASHRVMRRKVSFVVNGGDDEAEPEPDDLPLI
ncbi:MAG: hypothetical protein ACREXY_21040 [Gammaproteobacteria bacterium]